MGSSISRRDLVRWSLLGAGSVPLAALITACNDDNNGSSTGASTTVGLPPTTLGRDTTVGTTIAIDPNRSWWLQGNFAPVMDEVEAFDLAVRGALPPELNGLYVKNGSNPPRSDSPHWFFGDGMVHGLSLRNGSAEWYRNRYVQTQPYKTGAGFGEGAPGGEGNQSNVSALWHAGKLLTSGEVGFPYELSPADLSTVGA